VVEAAYARVEALDADVHAFLQLTPEIAFDGCRPDRCAASHRARDGRRSGGVLPPLAGIPAGLKDNMKPHWHERHRGFEDPWSLSLGLRLHRRSPTPGRGCGTGRKCNLDEFAFGSSTENSAYGPTHNPWTSLACPVVRLAAVRLRVSAGMVEISLGSDTGGSIRQPGSLTGTVALKPTYGRVSRYGIVAFGSSLDQIGPFGKSVDDVALALEAIAGADDMDATSAREPVPEYSAALDLGVKGLRVGVVHDLLDARLC